MIKSTSKNAFTLNPGTENEKGTGLGMDIINEFLQLNKAKLNIESQPGKGTTFYIHFSGPA